MRFCTQSKVVAYLLHLIFFRKILAHKAVLCLYVTIRQHLVKWKKYISLTLVTQNNNMIISFGSKETEKVWDGIRVKKLPNEIQNVGRRKMRMLNNSQDIADLRIPPSNRLEKLTGNLKEFYSIRINKQWRIIFIWNNGNASEVEIVDYH